MASKTLSCVRKFYECNRTSFYISFSLDVEPRQNNTQVHSARVSERNFYSYVCNCNFILFSRCEWYDWYKAKE